MATSESIRVLLVDDHRLVRAGLRMLIESQPGLKVIAEASNAEDALALASDNQPDVILLDLDLGETSGLDLLPQLQQAARQARVIILTGLRDPEVHHDAVHKGAMGVVLKEHAAEALVKAIEKVHGGEVWLDRATMASVLSQMARSRADAQADPEQVKIASLTDREREILKLVCEGLQNKQIAQRLYISDTTVRHHLTSIFSKLEVTSRLELVLYAYRHGLAKPPG